MLARRGKEAGGRSQALRDRRVPVEIAAALGWAFAFILIQGLPALAHNEDLFWSGLEWWTEDRNTTRQYYEFTEQVPGDSNGAFADRVAEGAQKWNAIDINGPDNHFVRNGVVANYGPFGGCSTIADWKNGIHYREIPDNPAARTRLCRDTSVFGTDRIRWFQVIFDPDYTFYTGDTIGGLDSGERDLEGLSAHEFGHAVGGWLESSDNYHFESPRDGTICDPPYTSKHTMCASFPTGSDSYYRRTLETHDIHTYVQRYAPGG
jgi:hypothetical protein